MNVHALSGRRVSELDVEAALAGELTPMDSRIHPDTLRTQAAIAAEHGNPELAENLLRAAELALLPDAEILAIYTALRPRRSTLDELGAIADRLAAAGATRNAAFIREAAETYNQRQLLR